MKCVIAIIAGLVLIGVPHGAAADNLVDNYYDLVRPNGQPRSDAVFQADLTYCYGQTGADRNAHDTPALKQCMLGRRWQWTDLSPSAWDPPPPDSPNPNIGWHWENGMRVCHGDCKDPEAPGSGYRCSNVTVLGMPMRECVN
jgi:hypothetical protein